MRVGSFVSTFLSRWCPSRAGRLLSVVAGLLLIPALSAAATALPKAAEKIAVLPEAPYYLYIAYESLIIFWIGILGLLIIIRMKLREIERTQALGADREDEDAPLLQ
ncbi:MAG: hypothetical protein ACYC7J_10180 [Syntrophales bacterium]